jgi:hypothetical protein
VSYQGALTISLIVITDDKGDQPSFHQTRGQKATGASLSGHRESGGGVKWDIEGFEHVASRAPVLRDLKPSGRFIAVDFHRAGGVPQLLKILLENDRINGDCITTPLKRRRTTWLSTDVPTLSPTVMHVRQTVQCSTRSASAPRTSANLSLACRMVIRR